MKKKQCVFCQLKDNDIQQYILYETEHLVVVHDGFPVTIPHFLIIPKEHVDTYSQVSMQIQKELVETINIFSAKIGENSFVFEHGGVGQTVHHAHLHILKFGAALNVLLHEIGIAGRLIELDSLSDLSKYGKYLFFSIAKKYWVLLPDLMMISPGIVTNTIARLLKQPYPAQSRRHILPQEINEYKDKYVQ